jgi:hypothetical protein
MDRSAHDRANELRKGVAPEDVARVLAQFPEADLLEPRMPDATHRKMAEEIGYANLKASLENSLTQYKLLKEWNVWAVDDCDITCTSGDDPISALKTDLHLVSSHITHDRMLMELIPEQLALF